MLTLRRQTNRHAASDAIDFDAAKFDSVVTAFGELAASLGINAFTAIPMSALDGDGVVAHTERPSWFQGPALLPHLESLELTKAHGGAAAHIAVQWVTRDNSDDYLRWITGDLAESTLPARISAISARLDLANGQWRDAVAGIDDGLPALGKANDLVRVEIEFAQALPLAAFAKNAALRAFVMVDPGTNARAAAGMIR